MPLERSHSQGGREFDLLKNTTPVLPRPAQSARQFDESWREKSNCINVALVTAVLGRNERARVFTQFRELPAVHSCSSWHKLAAKLHVLLPLAARRDRSRMTVGENKDAHMVCRGVKGPAAGAARRRATRRAGQKLVGVRGIVSARGPGIVVIDVSRLPGRVHHIARQLSIMPTQRADCRRTQGLAAV